MGYRKRKSVLEETLEGLFWMTGLSWKFGVVIVIGCFGGFLYTLPGAFGELAVGGSNPVVLMLPTLYTISCFALPGFWLLLAVVFAWASHRSWAKQIEVPSRWY